MEILRAFKIFLKSIIDKIGVVKFIGNVILSVLFLLFQLLLLILELFPKLITLPDWLHTLSLFLSFIGFVVLMVCVYKADKEKQKRKK